ncbi:MAG: glycosyltransferase [Gammaproteobacteria bacterium]|nr:glycosyltransferase [Gammaproteobacteria bacterium]
MSNSGLTPCKDKICHIITDLDVGGAEYMLKRLLEHQLGNKDSFSVVSLTGLGKIGEQLRAQGISVYTLNMSGKLAFPLALWRLVKLLSKLKPDLVQTWMYHADLLGGLAAYYCGIRRIVWGIHCSKLPIGRPLTKIVMMCCAKMSSWLPSQILCVAEAAKQNHIKYGYCSDKMLIVPNGFSAAKLVKTASQAKPLLAPYGVTSEHFVVGCVGRYHPDKGQDILIRAVEQVVQRVPQVKFVLAGRNCDANNVELTELVKKFQIADNVILLGERDDIPYLLPEFDLFCMPSRSEAFPVALGEAMLAGVPCVATNVGDAIELGGSETTYVEPLDISALALAIVNVSMLSTESLANKSLLGRERVQALYSIENVTQRYNAVYLDLLSR